MRERSHGVSGFRHKRRLRSSQGVGGGYGDNTQALANDIHWGSRILGAVLCGQACIGPPSVPALQSQSLPVQYSCLTEKVCIRKAVLYGQGCMDPCHLSSPQTQSTTKPRFYTLHAPIVMQRTAQAKTIRQ